MLRPNFCKDEHLAYLDELAATESDLHSVPALVAEFQLSTGDAELIVEYWSSLIYGTTF